MRIIVNILPQFLRYSENQELVFSAYWQGNNTRNLKTARLGNSLEVCLSVNFQDRPQLSYSGKLFRHLRS